MKGYCENTKKPANSDCTYDSIKKTADSGFQFANKKSSFYFRMNWKARNAGVVAVLVIGVTADAAAGPVTAGEAVQVAAATATTESPTAG